MSREASNDLTASPVPDSRKVRLPDEKDLVISLTIPTLNEEKFIAQMLGQLARQSFRKFEVIVIDGGDKGPSTDRTAEIARSMGAKVFLLRRGGIVDARNLGAHMSLGEIIVFTEADASPPPRWLETIYKQFDDETLAVAGPGIPRGGSTFVRLEYAVYNALRYIVGRLPKPLQHVSASGYNIAIRRDVFEKVGGFSFYPANDDGLLGREVAMLGKTKFSREAYVWISSRRFDNMGFFGANLHYVYVLENFLNFLAPILRPVRHRSAKTFRARAGVGK